MKKFRIGDFVVTPFGSLAQIVSEYPNGMVHIKGFNCADESYDPRRLKLYIPRELEQTFMRLEGMIKELKSELEFVKHQLPSY